MSHDAREAVRPTHEEGNGLQRLAVLRREHVHGVATPVSHVEATLRGGNARRQLE